MKKFKKRPRDRAGRFIATTKPKRKTTKRVYNAPKRSIRLRKKGRAKKPRPIKRRLDDIRKAELILYRPEGTDKVAESNWLTPTTRGFDSIERIVRDVVENHPTKSVSVEIYHYSLYLTFIGRNGQIVNDRLEGAGLPFFSWIKRVKGKREQVIQNARNAVRLRVYQMLSKHFDIMSPAKVAKGKKITEKQATKQLLAIKKGRKTKFKFVLYRTSAKRKRKRGRK